MRLILTFRQSAVREKSEKTEEHKKSKKKVTSITDYLCKWCLSYVGQRRQFCSADCAAQFKLCQRRREQRQVCS